MPRKSPNILFVMADQLAPQFLPVHGHKIVQAPNLMRLAERGVVFDAAYCNFPLCAPARYALMSGRLPSAIAAWDNAAEFSAEIPTFAHYLGALGYRTALAGKMHFCGPDQLHGFTERLTTDVYPADFTWTPDWDDPKRKLDWYHTMDVVRNAGICTRSSNLDFDDEVTFLATRHLFDLARAGEDRPFCLVASYINPHDPYLAREEYWNLYDGLEIDLPLTGPEDIAPDPHSRRLIEAIGMADPWPDAATISRARRAYYASVSYIDTQVGRLLTALREAGFAEDTIVVFTGDHGDMLGERGLWFKMSWFEFSARIPLIVSYPSAFAPRRVASAVSQIDLLPSLVDFATGGKGYAYPTPLEGRSLLGHLAGRGGHDEAIGEYFAEGTSEPVIMIRRGGLKFVHAAGDPDQLYDLAVDPQERRNLAIDPAYAARVEEFRREIAARWDEVGLKTRILESQRRRRHLAPIMQAAKIAWDYQPFVDATKAYIRNSLPIYEIEKRSRFP